MPLPCEPRLGSRLRGNDGGVFAKYSRLRSTIRGVIPDIPRMQFKGAAARQAGVWILIRSRFLTCRYSSIVLPPERSPSSRFVPCSADHVRTESSRAMTTPPLTPDTKTTASAATKSPLSVAGVSSAGASTNGKSAGSESTPVTLAELQQMVSRRRDPSETLTIMVDGIRQMLKTEVCSVYLLEPDRATLVLAATVGLRQASVGKVRMQLHEGLAGLVAQQLGPVVVDDAARHPRFKYFPDAGEEPYQSFLGVPLVDRGLMQGVLVVQRRGEAPFVAAEIDTFCAAATQLGPVISDIRGVEQFVVPAKQRLWTLARNLWWSWDYDTANLFRDLDPIRWRQLDHNPIALLAEMPLERLEERIDQLALHNRIHYAYRRLQEYLGDQQTWGASHTSLLRSRPVAYFSAEFGLHESLPIYSGGLGLLAGDHLKSASDLDIPLIGIGLFYGQGYFRQRIDSAGWQQEDYIDVVRDQLPVEPALSPDGQQVVVSMDTRGGSVQAKVWRVAVGRRTLLLLDTDVEGNRPEDRLLTARLYGGDDRVRVRQELLLGVGGMRVLRALGIDPGVLHLNEGHSAFAVLEEIRWQMQEDGVDFDEAMRRVARKTTFTTHTPVPAGHDRFSPDLIEEHLGPLRDALGITEYHLMALGRVDPDRHDEPFCMTVLAMKLSRLCNAVSSLHGEVSRAMWTSLWPQRNEESIPIGHITNGVHVPTWLAPQMHGIYERYLGTDWPKRSSSAEAWRKIEQVNDGELWEAHLALKARLLDFVRRRAVRQARRNQEPEEMVESLRRVLSSDCLTIGFARRFATYKRADLLLSNIQRIAKLINDPQRPIQLVFAGKSHPLDTPGKQVLQRIQSLARDPVFAGKIVFVEDYDINVGRHFVQGVDVWLNNPRRPLEASGTSGQKVVLNGGLNLSVLDGWWAEAYQGDNGFAIGLGETHRLVEVHDSRDAEGLYQALEREVIPLFYDRDRDGLPRGWIARMKRAIRTLGWRFNADRMVKDYVEKCYIPAAGGLSCDMTRCR